MSPTVALVTRLCREAVGGSVEAATQAVEVIDLARRAGDHHLYAVAQQDVYAAVVGRGASAPAHLVDLADALGFAVDEVAARLT